MNPETKKVGILSLFSDIGHVIPLLRVATSFSENDYDVTVYLPDENKDLANQYPVKVKTFGRILENINKDFYIDLFEKTLFYNAFSSYIDVNRNLIHPLIVNICRRLPSIKEMIEQDSPGLLIADNFLFNDFTTRLAARIDSQLVFHSSGGNYRFQSRQFICHFGFSSAPVWFQDWILKRGYFHNRRYEKQVENEIRFYWSFFRDTLKGLFPDYPVCERKPVFIATGISHIEKEKIGTVIENDNFQLFPALKDRRNAEIAPELLSWLQEDGDRPVVYVGFGTVLKGNAKLMKSIIHGLKDLGTKVLWNVATDQQAVVKGLGLPDCFRLESFVPQPQILGLDCVRCFVTHGGAGGIQEGLLAGKPMLCIPIMTDQPFNSSVVEKLGVGIKIWKQQVSPGAIRKNVKRLLKEKSFRVKARELKQELELMDGGLELIRHLEKTGHNQ